VGFDVQVAALASANTFSACFRTYRYEPVAAAAKSHHITRYGSDARSSHKLDAAAKSQLVTDYGSDARSSHKLVTATESITAAAE
jgi:hypothetical protein